MKTNLRLAVLSIVIGLLACVAGATTVEDYGTFSVHYYGLGESLNGTDSAKDFTAAEKTATQRAVNYIQTAIDDIPSPRDVNVHFIWGDLAPTVLGSSGSSFQLLTGGSTDFVATNTETLWRYGLNVGDANTIDCAITYNPDFSWYTGADAGGIGGSEFDLQSVVTHEITHALGFLSSYNTTTDKFDSFSTSPPPTNYLTTWDMNLEDAAGNIPEAGTSGDPGDFNELDDPVFWTGNEANTLYQSYASTPADAKVGIYAPDPYNGGSSLSHVDELGADGIDNTADDITAIMNWNISNGVTKREYHEVELAMLEDLGWYVEPVPEPATLSLLAMGGLALLRRRKR